MNKAKYLNDVLTSMEAEEIISKQLQTISLDTYGSQEFMVQHGYLEKLNMQAIKNALMGGEDFILENFVTYEKLEELVKELFVANHFKAHIYPKIKSKISEMMTCKMYICLYHEAVIVNLLENFFYYVTACKAIQDYIIDIIEYCYSKISRSMSIKSNSTKELDPFDLDLKYEEIEFTISMASISIMRYITDHLEQLPFPIRNHLLNLKDVPLLLVALMEVRPWYKEYTSNEKTNAMIFENNQWIPVSSNNLPKLEAQVWISLFNLLMNSDNNKKYEITEFRKSNLLRLRKYMNETLYDQIPPLQQMFRVLEEMSLVQFPSIPTSSPLVIELIPMLYNKKYNVSELDIIAEKALKYYFPSNQNTEVLRKEMDILSDIYSMNNIEYFMEDPKCASCGKDATNRCSKCKSEWYCGRECQIKRWKSHKEVCSKLAEINNELKEKEEISKKSDDNTAKKKIFEELD